MGTLSSTYGNVNFQQQTTKHPVTVLNLITASTLILLLDQNKDLDIRAWCQNKHTDSDENEYSWVTVIRTGHWMIPRYHQSREMFQGHSWQLCLFYSAVSCPYRQCRRCPDFFLYVFCASFQISCCPANSWQSTDNLLEYTATTNLEVSCQSHMLPRWQWCH